MSSAPPFTSTAIDDPPGIVAPGAVTLTFSSLFIPPFSTHPVTSAAVVICASALADQVQLVAVQPVNPPYTSTPPVKLTGIVSVYVPAHAKMRDGFTAAASAKVWNGFAMVPSPSLAALALTNTPHASLTSAASVVGSPEHAVLPSAPAPASASAGSVSGS